MIQGDEFKMELDELKMTVEKFNSEKKNLYD